MSADDEEQDILDAKIADADWCKVCQMPIGLGDCQGCIAVGSFDAQFGEDDGEAEDD